LQRGFLLLIFVATMGRRMSYLVLASVAMVLASCDSFESVRDSCVLPASNIDVTFDICGSQTTKSSIHTDENEISNLVILAYSEGRLEVESRLVAGSSSLVMSLVKGRLYDLYALANFDERAVFPAREENLASFSCSYASLDELEDGFPMAWSCSSYCVYGGSPVVRVELVRLTCRIDFSVDASALGGVEVTSVRLRQAPSEVRPFMPGGSRALHGDQMLDGDYASSMDLESINIGLPITLYTIENMQGNLLPDNSDPWQKVPGNFDESGLCTYLEVACNLTDSSPLEGSVVYRFYLGRDNTSNFDVERNTDIHVALTATSAGVFQLSWRVVLDGGYKGGLAEGGQLDDSYGLTDKYVGQKFLYEVSLDERLSDFFDQLGDSFSLRYEASEGRNAAVQVTRTGESQFLCTCMDVGEGMLCLYDSLDHKIAELDGVAVKLPHFRIGSLVGGRVVAGSLQPLAINDAPTSVRIYLISDDGRNLYTSDDVFDISQFELDVTVTNDEEYEGVDNAVSTMVDDFVGGSLAELSMSVNHPGTDEDQCMQLTGSLDGRNPMHLYLADDAHPGLEAEYDMEMTMLPVELNVYDVENDAFSILKGSTVENYQRRWNDGVVVQVVNPSCLPLSCSFMAGAGANGSLTGSDTFTFEGIALTTTSSKITNVAARTYDSYLANMFVTQPQSMRFNKLRDESWMTLPDGSEVYELVSSEMMYKAVRYSRYPGSQQSFFNTFNLWLTYDETYSLSGKATVSDILSDGSMEYGDKYGRENGYWDRGLMLWDKASSQSRLSETPSDVPVALRNFSPSMVSAAVSASPLAFVLGMNSNGSLTLACANNTQGKQFTVTVTGEIGASVTVYPNGTWGSSKTYTKTFSYSVTRTLTPTRTATALDTQYTGFCQAMKDLYATTYTDSNNKIGSSDSFPHRMHPTSISMTVSVTSSDYGLYPLEISSNDIAYYHGQDSKTYTITPSVSGSGLYSITTISGL